MSKWLTQESQKTFKRYLKLQQNNGQKIFVFNIMENETKTQKKGEEKMGKTVKRCPQCKGTPQFVYYAIPQKIDPEGWEEEEDGPRPMILFKRIECVDCKATTPYLYLTIDDAIIAWNEEQKGCNNHRMILEYRGTESCSEVEPLQPD